MPSLESQIDDLYKKPLAEFVPSRTALAKTLDKASAARVKTLAKPTVVPWAVNQVYWHARDVFDRVMKSGRKLRDAQVAALSRGKGADVPAATQAHRAAIADAVAAASRLSAAVGASPNGDELARTLEALSLAGSGGEPPGRLTKPVALAGFEALAGVAVKALGKSVGPTLVETLVEKTGARQPSKADLAKAAAAEREREAADRKQRAELQKAERTLAEARHAEELARAAWQRARDRVTYAERSLSALSK